MHKGFLFLLYIDILRVSPQHEKRDGADPYASVEVPVTSRIVIGSIKEVAVGFGQEAIAREGKGMLACNNLNTNGLSAIRQIAAQLVGPTDHRKVVVRERPIIRSPS